MMNSVSYTGKKGYFQEKGQEKGERTSPNCQRVKSAVCWKYDSEFDKM